MMAMSENNRRQTLPYLGAQTIGYDKLNQLRHTAYFENAAAVHKHMMKLAEFIGKKFEITLNALDSIRDYGIAEWTEPKGGYFVSLNVIPGTAKRVYQLMNAAGVVLTPVGATYPYGVDPRDENLRIAPTYPSDEELKIATAILALTVRLAAVEYYLNK